MLLLSWATRATGWLRCIGALAIVRRSQQIESGGHADEQHHCGTALGRPPHGSGRAHDAAFGLASVPTGFAIDHILIVPATVLFVGIAAALWARGFRSASTVKPSAAELVLAFADALILPCVLGAIWIGAYWVIHSVTSLAGGPADAIALWVAAPLIAFIAWFAAEFSAADAAKELYPDAVGAPSPFAPTIATQGRRLYGYFLAAILGAAGLTLLSAHLTGDTHSAGLDLVLLGYGALAGGLARPARWAANRRRRVSQLPRGSRAPLRGLATRLSVALGPARIGRSLSARRRSLRVSERTRVRDRGQGAGALGRRGLDFGEECRERRPRTRG